VVHHSDRGCQYLSIRYTERLKEAGVEPSVGSGGCAYDNALAELASRWFKSVVTHRRGLGVISKMMSTPHSFGWIGSTIGG
jgi:transposase InsO family protein